MGFSSLWFILKHFCISFCHLDEIQIKPLGIEQCQTVTHFKLMIKSICILFSVQMKQKHLLSGSSLLLAVLILHSYRASPGISRLVVIAHEDRKLGRDVRPCSAHFWSTCALLLAVSPLYRHHPDTRSTLVPKKREKFFLSVISLNPTPHNCFVVVIQLLSHVRLFATPWTITHRASLSFTVSWSELTFTSTESVMPSNLLILRRPLLLLPSVFPSIRVFSSEWALHIRWPKYWSFSFSISPSNEYSGLISFRINWFDLLAVQESSPPTHLGSVDALVLSLLYGPAVTSVHDYWKNHVWQKPLQYCKVISLQLIKINEKKNQHSFDYTDLCHCFDIPLHLIFNCFF